MNEEYESRLAALTKRIEDIEGTIVELLADKRDRDDVVAGMLHMGFSQQEEDAANDSVSEDTQRFRA